MTALIGEIAALYGAGCRYIQIDETNLPFLCDPVMRKNVTVIGEDPDTLPMTYVKLLNDCLRDVPAGIVMCAEPIRVVFGLALVALAVPTP